MIFLLLFLTACIGIESDEPVTLSAKIDTLQTTIGEPVFYNISINHPDTNLIDFPSLIFKEDLQLRSSSFNAKKNNYEAILELVFWDTGSIVIPEISINIMNSDSITTYSIVSDSILMDVVSVKEKNINLNAGSDGILPIKGPVEIQSYENLFLILKIILLIIIGYWIISLWRKRIKNESSPQNSNIYRKPFEIALEKLEKINLSNISNNELKKEFFVSISFILREYVENTFFIRALEMTTEEIAEFSETFPFENNLSIKLISILRTADLVKYAKDDRGIHQCLKDHESSVDFVKKSSRKVFAIDD